jgi:hypothetical protein
MLSLSKRALAAASLPCYQAQLIELNSDALQCTAPLLLRYIATVKSCPLCAHCSLLTLPPEHAPITLLTKTTTTAAIAAATAMATIANADATSQDSVLPLWLCQDCRTGCTTEEIDKEASAKEVAKLSFKAAGHELCARLLMMHQVARHRRLRHATVVVQAWWRARFIRHWYWCVLIPSSRSVLLVV